VIGAHRETAALELLASAESRGSAAVEGFEQAVAVIPATRIRARESARIPLRLAGQAAVSIPSSPSFR
jgi:hypothetical protein